MAMRRSLRSLTYTPLRRTVRSRWIYSPLLTQALARYNIWCMQADRIREAHQRVLDADTTADTLRTERDDLIRQALAEGMTVADIAEITGLHPQRIYQIRAGRR